MAESVGVNHTQDKKTKIPKHGTRYRYVTFGCRCEKCRKANAAYHNQRVEALQTLVQEKK